MLPHPVEKKQEGQRRRNLDGHPRSESSNRLVVIVSLLHLVLHLDVLSDDFVRDVSTARDKVSAGPQMPPPELTSEGSVFTE